MFKLRRELQAVREYRVLEDQPRLEKWAKRLVEHYLKIGEMVPEWQDELEREVAESLKQAASKGDFQQVARSVRKLGLSCRSCHRDYRAVAAARYRSPDYSRITVENSETLETEPLKDAMKRLSQLVNRVKIAAEDDRMPVAEEALAGLRQHLEDLGGSCKQCHSDPAPRLRILGDDTRASIDLIGQGIAREDKTLIGRNLGELAVGACARCHSVHRTLSDLKSVMMSSGVP
ncbi:MAG: cytochrome c [Gammaproteobacteria bacterium]|nr:cytochrome c [Gammaproteobacteria bacterium]